MGQLVNFKLSSSHLNTACSESKLSVVKRLESLSVTRYSDSGRTQKMG